MSDTIGIQFGRFAVRWQGVRAWRFWFQSWRPAWFGGHIRYITLGLGPVAFYAGDPAHGAKEQGGEWCCAAHAAYDAQVTTHDYTNGGWGHDVTWTLATPDGHALRAMGWTTPLPKDGDYAILGGRDGATTRYRFTEVEYMHDPRDMWSATLQFAPRRVKE